MELQRAQREILELIVQMREKPAPDSATLVVEPVSEGPVQGATLVNADNFSAMR